MAIAFFNISRSSVTNSSFFFSSYISLSIGFPFPGKLFGLSYWLFHLLNAVSPIPRYLAICEQLLLLLRNNSTASFLNSLSNFLQTSDIITPVIFFYNIRLNCLSIKYNKYQLFNKLAYRSLQFFRIYRFKKIISSTK